MTVNRNALIADRVFHSDCSTKEVYEEGVREVVLSVVSGINSSIFAYGQTSSGKTYTMTGVTEYTVADIYDYINKVRIILIHPQVAWSVLFCCRYNKSSKKKVKVQPKMHVFSFLSMKREHLF